ncbi:hypothetical protein [Rhizobium sp. AAP43]|uniref:hypothetical protein n=1 Tax=Rhizobium sp. AAP43 TaxID=1523420 RepID=UPI0006B9185A|nr:hypothetical protein [Rhizobium sp. AAP43]
MAEPFGLAPDPARHSPTAPLAWVAAAYVLLTIGIVLLLNLPAMRDYVGEDNDDVMRLVQVRDLLAGQGWFDLTQYRLGPDGGTLMHWSRLVDLPIMLLIRLFAQFLPMQQAEAVALAVWPLLLVAPLMIAMAVAGRRIGTAVTVHVALMLTAVFVITSNRFLPGAIDHHNLQLVLVAVIAAALLDPRRAGPSYAVAGLACAAALAIGAETTPLIAVVCAIVAVLWGLYGPVFAAAARAFSLALLLGLSLLFVATVPPQHYAVVTCDSLSIGYYAILAVGTGLLFAASFLPRALGLTPRFAVLAGIGLLVAGAAISVAPQCLQNPLNELDPLLHTLWLNGVIEARSFFAQLAEEPATIGVFYAVGFFAIAVCVFRVVDGDRLVQHGILLALLFVSFLVALVQVRGGIFANLLAIPPLALLISELRGKANDQPEHLGAGLLFALTAFLSVPSVWGLGGVMVAEGTAGVSSRLKDIFATQPAVEAKPACETPDAFAALAREPATLVVAPSDYGAEILRFTHHRALTGPYHRNQAGMLTEIHIGLATPEEAPAFLRGVKAGILAFCPDEGQTQRIAETKPDGLYATLGRGVVPAYLVPITAKGATSLQIYRVVLP